MIDADHLKRWIFSRVFKTELNVADVIDQIDREDTIEPEPHSGRRVYQAGYEEGFEAGRKPERKTGRWVHDGYAFKGGIDWMHCSECGHKDSWSVATRTPFCAWCGARMEGEE